MDSNIFMCVAGAAHAYKKPSVAFLERVARSDIDAVIDAEVLQEILHRYRALERWPEGAARSTTSHGASYRSSARHIRAEVLDAARLLPDRHSRLQERDALHAAPASAYGVRQICSYDRDFDVVEGLERIEPVVSCRRPRGAG